MSAIAVYIAPAPRVPAHSRCTHYKYSAPVSSLIVYTVSALSVYLNCSPFSALTAQTASGQCHGAFTYSVHYTYDVYLSVH